MTKSELVEKLLTTNTVLTRKDSEMVVDIVFDSMRNALKNGEKVEIRGFGSFTIRERKSERGQKSEKRPGSEYSFEKDPILQDGQGTS